MQIKTLQSQRNSRSSFLVKGSCYYSCPPSASALIMPRITCLQAIGQVAKKRREGAYISSFFTCVATGFSCIILPPWKFRVCCACMGAIWLEEEEEGVLIARTDLERFGLGFPSPPSLFLAASHTEQQPLRLFYCRLGWFVPTFQVQRYRRLHIAASACAAAAAAAARGASLELPYLRVVVLVLVVERVCMCAKGKRRPWLALVVRALF